MDGSGWVRTSSPTASIRAFPSASHDSIATPNDLALISPAQTGVAGVLPAKAMSASVPPVIECSWTRGPTASCTQW